MSTQTKITLQSITDAGHDDTDAAMIRALCAFLDCEPSELKRESYDHYGLALFEYGKQSYAIGNDSEADAAALDNIKDSVWAFNASFILSECGLPSELEAAIKAFQEDKCESANDALLALVEKCCKDGIAEFAKSTIGADGRGHFLAQYDSEENEQRIDGDNNEMITFYIYRTN